MLHIFIFSAIRKFVRRSVSDAPASISVYMTFTEAWTTFLTRNGFLQSIVHNYNVKNSIYVNKLLF